MTIATFSVPIDIPWRRIAFSSDMMDKTACDRELPLRWRSSIAIFEYEPPKDQQRIDGFKVSYLKVTCSITGYQPADQQIRIRERLERSNWTPYSPTNVSLNDALNTYHACYGAMLEVVVAPSVHDNVNLEDYPYFADFDPKKRELYEQVTDTGEVMSRSLDDVGVRLGQTTSQSHEVRDSVSLGASISAGPKGGPGASAGLEHSTTDLNQRSTENVRTTDSARENRETLSHTTQLSQMYHQLNSYHLGTNRAVFFVMPRPHVVQSTDPNGTPLTFVDGPRQLEGIQEFMLVVVRPKSQEQICVEAYLETGHLLQTEVRSNTTGGTSTPLDFPKLETGNNPSTLQTVTTDGKFQIIEARAKNLIRGNAPMPGYVVDTKHPKSDPLTPGFHIETEMRLGDVKPHIDVQDEYVLVTCEAVSRTYIDSIFRRAPEPASYEMHGTIFWTKKEVAYDETLLITGRRVCSCSVSIYDMLPYEKEISVVYEKQLEPARSRSRGIGDPMPIYDANRLGAQFQREIIQSLSSADRYPRGTVSLLDTQFVAKTMGEQLRHADLGANIPLLDWVGINEELVRRVTAYAPSMNRAQLLEMPLARQVEAFGLTFAEAVEIRRSLMNLDEPQGLPPIPERRQVEVPLLTGLQSNEANASLAVAGLIFGSKTIVESPLTSGSVIAQEPPAGAVVDLETEVSVQLASGLSVRLPEVIGVGLSEATCRLRDAGLQSEPTVRGRPGPDAHVVALEPPAGTLVTPNTPITISLRLRT